MYLAIVGSRHYHNYNNFSQLVTKYIQKHGHPDIIISGGAPGVDSLAEIYARENHISFKVYKANWTRYGKSAGPKRNSKIVSKATHLLAFPSCSSIGTRDTIKKAIDAELYVSIRNI